MLEVKVNVVVNVQDDLLLLGYVWLVCKDEVLYNVAVILTDVIELLKIIDVEDDCVELKETNGRRVYLDVELLFLEDVVVEVDDYVL